MGLRKRKLGLALGGGGARGLSHIGVLQSLERADIPVDLLVGTSIGALVGGAFCCGLGAVELEQRATEYLESKEFESSAIKAFEAARGKQDLTFHQKIQRFFKNRYYMVQSLFRPGLLSQEDFQVTINHFIPDISIKETRIPFRAVATDLISGERIVFSKGSLRQAVAASCAVPGAVAPFKEGEWLLSDGGIICNIPVSVARQEGAEVVVAVPVDRDACSESECDTVLGIYFRASEIMANQLEQEELLEADIVIRPNVGSLHWSSFSQARDLINEGEKAADAKLNDIRSSIFGLKGFLRTLPKRTANRMKKSSKARPLQ